MVICIEIGTTLMYLMYMFHPSPHQRNPAIPRFLAIPRSLSIHEVPLNLAHAAPPSISPIIRSTHSSRPLPSSPCPPANPSREQHPQSIPNRSRWSIKQISRWMKRAVSPFCYRIDQERRTSRSSFLWCSVTNPTGTGP